MAKLLLPTSNCNVLENVAAQEKKKQCYSFEKQQVEWMAVKNSTRTKIKPTSFMYEIVSFQACNKSIIRVAVTMSQTFLSFQDTISCNKCYLLLCFICHS